MESTPVHRIVRFGAFEVDLRSRELRKHGLRIKLQDQPFRVLELLLEHPGELITREEFQAQIWPVDTFVDFELGLNTAMKRLRQALDDSADSPRFIETLPRRGYRFVFPVNEDSAPPSDAAGVASAVAITHPGVESSEAASISEPLAPMQVGHRPRWIAAALSILLIALLAAGAYLAARHRRTITAGGDIHSIAVLPLENLSGDPSQDYFADGMTDALTTYLAQMRGIRVISRTSAMHYKGTKKTLSEIAKELGVDAVVEGSASRASGVVHVNAQLIYVPGDSHIWAHSYESAASRLATMESEIANDLARKIGATMPLEIGKHPSTAVSVNPEAYDLYLRSKPYYGLATRDANDQAIGLLEKSVEVDPQFAAAHAALAAAYGARAIEIEVNEPRWIEKASAEVGKALTLDSDLAEGYVSRGYLLWSRANGWSYERAVSDYRHALELNPNLAEAHHQLGVVYNHLGLLEKADGEIKKAVALDPLNTASRFRVGANLFYQGKYDESLAELGDSEKLLPPFWAFQTSLALQHLGRQQEAQERIDRFLRATPLDPGGSLTAMQALLAADAGEVALAEHKIREAIAKGKGYQTFHHVTYAAASAYALLNRREQALQYLRLTAEDGFPCFPLFEHDSNLDHLRNDPRFLSFLAEQKKQWEYFRDHL